MDVFSWGPLPQWAGLLPCSITVSSPCSTAFLLRSGQSAFYHLLSDAGAAGDTDPRIKRHLILHSYPLLLLPTLPLKIACVIDIPARFFSWGVNGIRMSVSYETGEGDMHFSWARVCAGPQTSTVPGFLLARKSSF